MWFDGLGYAIIVACECGARLRLVRAGCWMWGIIFWCCGFIAGTCELATSRPARNDVLCDLHPPLASTILFLRLHCMGRPSVDTRSCNLLLLHSRSFLHVTYFRSSLTQSPSTTRSHSILSSTSKHPHHHRLQASPLYYTAPESSVTSPITPQLHKKLPSPCSAPPVCTSLARHAKRSASDILSHLVATRAHRRSPFANVPAAYISSSSPRSLRLSTTSLLTPSTSSATPTTAKDLLTTHTMTKNLSNSLPERSSDKVNRVPDAVTGPGPGKKRGAGEAFDKTESKTTASARKPRRAAVKEAVVEEEVEVEAKAKKPRKATASRPVKILPPLAERTQNIQHRIGAHVSIAGGKLYLEFIFMQHSLTWHRQWYSRRAQCHHQHGLHRVSSASSSLLDEI